MPRTRIALAVFFYTTFALAQPFKVEPDAAADAGTSEAGAAPADAAVPAPVWPREPAPSATATTSSSSGPRPDPGPGLRERGGRTRRANPASGVLLVIIIVVGLGWYVVKRLRRF